jgi:hypothetical protein
MPTADVRGLLLRGLVAVALGAAAIIGGIHHGELGTEGERAVLEDRSITPERQPAALAPSPSPFVHPRAAPDLAHPSTSVQDVTLVVSSEGAPVSRYVVTVDRRKRSSTEMILRTQVDESRGRRPVITLRPGQYALHVVADVGSAALAFEVEEGPNEPISISLTRFGAVRGLLVDAKSLRPVRADLEFRVIPKDARTGRLLTSAHLSAITQKISSDAAGAFSLSNMESGNVGVQLRDPVTDRPIWIMERDENGVLRRGSSYLGELLPGQDLNLGIVRSKRGYDLYR